MDQNQDSNQPSSQPINNDASQMSTQTPQPAIPPQPYSAQQSISPAQQPAAKHSGKGLSVTSLIFGIVGLVLFWVPLLGIGSAITGVVLGIVALVKKSDGKGMAIAGLICGGLAIVPGIIAAVMGAAILSLLGIAIGGTTTLVNEYDKYLENPISYCLENPSSTYCYDDDDWEWDYDYDYDYDYDDDETMERSIRF